MSTPLADMAQLHGDGWNYDSSGLVSLNILFIHVEIHFAINDTFF